MGSLGELFNPTRVAVVGATEREGSVGRAIVENLLSDFAGEVVPVNPNVDAVFDVRCVSTLAETDGVDLAVVVVNPDVSVDVVRQAGEQGIDHVVVITAGFGETGGEGVRRERELIEIAKRYDLKLVGPNSLGVMSTASGLNATFGPDNAQPGPISFLSQSGAFVTAVLDWANDEGIGFKDVVSLGNKAVLDETDFVETWGSDPETDVIVGYVESIERGSEFMRIAREVTKETPIVLVKSGRTEAGARAASSHTGAIAGSERATETALRQAGVIRVETVGDLFDFAVMLSGQPLPSSNGVGVVTNAGGPGVMATDAVGDSTLSLASLSEGTVEALHETMPEGTNVYNPVDVLGDANVDRFRTALDLVLRDEGIGMTLVLSAPTAVIDFDELAETIVDLHRTYEKPIAVCLMGGERTRRASETLTAAGIPVYFDPDGAVRSLDTLASQRSIVERSVDPPEQFDVDRERARAILETVRDRRDNRLGLEAIEILDAYGIPTPHGEIVDAPDEAVRVSRGIHGDVVMKIVSPDVVHKSDIGGVVVGVPDGEVADTFENLVTRVRNYQPDATILGVQVQELVDIESGTETIIGSNRDPQFGPLLMFGLGGIFVEILEDTTFRVAPIGESEARSMLDEIRSAPLLRGARGREPVDESAIVEALGRLSQLVTDFPSILELDVNPLVATSDGVWAVDVRITVDEEKL